MKRIFTGLAILFLILLLAFFTFRKGFSQRANETGISFYQNDQLNEAIRAFKVALRWFPKNEEAHTNLIRTYISLDESELAASALTELQKYYANDAGTILLEGQIMLLRDDFENALTVLDRALEKNDTLAHAYYFRGIARANLGDLAGAAADYKRAQELDINDLESIEQRAIIMGRLANYQEAIRDYDRLLELNPSNVQAFLNRGNFKLEIEDYEGAVADFSQTLNLDSRLAEAYFKRGGAYARKGDFEKALADFRKSIEMDYKLSSSQFNAGKAALQLNKLVEAESFLRKVAEGDSINDRTADAMQLLGVIKMMEGKYPAAIDYFSRTIAIDADHQDAFYHRGVSHGLAKDYLKAVRDLDHSRKLGKNSADLYYALGVNKIALNNFAGGCADLEVAAEMGSAQASQMQQQYCKNYMQ